MQLQTSCKSRTACLKISFMINNSEDIFPCADETPFLRVICLMSVKERHLLYFAKKLCFFIVINIVHSLIHCLRFVNSTLPALYDVTPSAERV